MFKTKLANSPLKSALLAVVWAQGAIIGYFIHLKLFASPLGTSLENIVASQWQNNFHTLVYIEFGTSLFFGIFGYQIGKSLRELDFSNQKLSKLNIVKDQYVASCSHDLKSPLNNMRGYAQLLASELKDDSDEKEMAVCIVRNVDSLRELIDDILDLNDAQMLSGNIELKYIDIDQILHDAVSKHANLAARKGLQLRYHRNIGGYNVFGHKVLLTRGVNNLLSNAIKFTHSGGTINVSVKLQASGELAISVEDTGIGIPREKLAQLFAPAGYRRKGTSGERSSGIGLRVVREAAEKMHGSLAVQSAEGKGSRFTLNLPAAAPALAKQPQQSAA